MKKYIFPVFILLGTFLASCSTTVGVKTERPAILDIKDAKSIYIERFLTANEMRHLHSIKTNENDILRNLDSTTNTSARIEDEKEVLALIYWELNKAFEENKKIKLTNNKNEADIILKGGITFLSTNTQNETRTQIDKKGYANSLTWFWRNVTLAMNYQIYETKTNNILEDKDVKYTLKSEEKLQNYLTPSVIETLENQIKLFATSISKEFEPYTEQKELKLLFHKDTVMKTATTFAQNGDLERSRKEFEAIYKKKNYFEAGYNAIIITQALGDLDTAWDEMTLLYEKFGDKRALEAIQDIESEIASTYKLQSQNYSE